MTPFTEHLVHAKLILLRSIWEPVTRRDWELQPKPTKTALGKNIWGKDVQLVRSIFALLFV